MISMRWTGLHQPSAIKQSRDHVVTPAPCEQCSDRQQRACSAGPLTCSAYIRFFFRGGRQTRDVDAEPALAELVPLLDCNPSGAKGITSVLLRAAKISAAAYQDEPPAPAAKPRMRGTERQREILRAVDLCDGTVRELARVCGSDDKTIRNAAGVLVRRGELVAVKVPGDPGRGAMTAFRRPA